MVASVFKRETPLAIIKNNWLIVAGASLLNAFDRLEVAEYSAKAFIFTTGFGEIYHIEDEEIEQLEEAFNL